MQDPSGSLDLLTRLAPPDRRVQAALKTLGSVTAHDWATLAEGTPERLADLRMQVGELQAALSTLPPRTPQRATLLHLAETMRQGTTMLTSGDQDANRLNLIRDAAMFGNTRTALDVLFPGQKAMLWAHNFHISKVPAQGQSYVNLGQHLARALGTSYRTVGFSFGDGELRAVSGDPAQQVKGPVVLTAAPAPRDSLDTLISGNAPAIYLNVAQARQNPVLNAWLAQPIRIASVGAVYTPGLPTGANVVLPQAFDGVIFVKRSSAAGALGRK